MGTQRLGLGADPRTDTDEDHPLTDEELVYKWRRFLWLERVIFRGHRPLFLLSFVLSLVCFLAEWAGYRGKYQSWGDPKPLGEIWWHLPIGFAFTLGTLWMLYEYARIARNDRGD